MTKRMERFEAKQRGDKFYTTGRPCIRGHTCKRKTKTGMCIECGNINAKEFYKKNADKINAASKKRHREYYEKNKERLKSAVQRRYAQNKKSIKAYRRTHYEANKHKYIAQAKARKKHIKIATPEWACMVSIEAIYKIASDLTINTGIPHHVDHVIPLRGNGVCGLHVHYNLAPIPAIDNLKKNKRY